MQTVLGLDISSKTIGWGWLGVEEQEIKLLEHGHIKPLKSGKYSLVERLFQVAKDIDALCTRLKPDIVAIEEITQFMPNKSSAKTIIALAVFNRVASLQTFITTKKVPQYYYPISIRSKIAKFYNTGKLTKEDMPALLNKKLGFVINYSKKDNSIRDFTYDEADGVSVGLTALITANKLVK